MEKEKKEKKKEEQLNLAVSTPPHIRDKSETQKIMFLVVMALLPVVFLALYLFRVNALLVISLTILSAVLTEYIIQKIRKIPITINDGSAILTGLLLALCLPPKVPFWIPLIGGAVAIFLGKQVYGGLGYNIYNPALVGRAVLLLSWTKHLTRDWYETISVDIISGATPLYIAQSIKEGAVKADLTAYYRPLLFANPYGCIGEVSAVLLILGGLFLIWVKVIDARIPLSYIGTAFVLSYFFGGDPFFYTIAGGLLVGAFFMATDYVTSPVTPAGKIIFGAGCGLITTVIRFYASAPKSVTYRILFMNTFTPLIDRYVLPKKFGMVKAE